MPTTDWRARVTPLDVLGDNGAALLVPMMAGSDDIVAIDLAPVLDEDEVLTDVDVTLIRLASYEDPVDEDVTTESAATPHEVDGTTVFQRINSLDAGRYYRMQVLHGAAGNRRGSSMLIQCVE